MEWLIKVLSSAIKSFEEVRLPKGRGLNGIIIYVPDKCDQITWTSMSA